MRASKPAFVLSSHKCPYTKEAGMVVEGEIQPYNNFTLYYNSLIGLIFSYKPYKMLQNHFQDIDVHPAGGSQPVDYLSAITRAITF